MAHATGQSGSGQSDGGRPFLGPWLQASPLLPVLAILLYAATGQFAGDSTFWSVVALGLIASGAALIVGAFFGFLFGLPRMIQEPAPASGMVINANLDQISDWLTKILIGLGLVELGRVAGGIDSLATALEPGLGGGESAHALAIGLLIYSAIDGFLIGYLWTRIVVSRQLKQAADELSRNKDLDQVLLDPPPAPPPPLPQPPQPQPSATGTQPSTIKP